MRDGLEELNKDSHTNPETEEYGISSLFIAQRNHLIQTSFGIMLKKNSRQILYEAKDYFG